MSDPATSLLEKISSYNLFNYLFTGAVFLIGVDRIAGTECAGWSLIAFVLVAYFMGMVLSRIGSLMVEPIFKRTGFVKYTAYADFVKAEKTDAKIAPLLEMNNIYRTLIALFIVLGAVKVVVALTNKYPNLTPYIEWSWPFALALLFAIAYRKQTKFIFDRVTSSSNAPRG
jgi:hypothetical protein